MLEFNKKKYVTKNTMSYTGTKSLVTSTSIIKFSFHQGHEHGSKAIRRCKVGVARMHGAFQGSGRSRTGPGAREACEAGRVVGRAACAS